MHQNEELIEKFYSSFKVLDAAGMASCYHPEIVFSDPVFGRLSGTEASTMWKMLCSRAKDLKISFTDVRADDTTGTVHWEAQYKFSKTGRSVHNVIEASFAFRAGRIIKHDDSFSLWKWSSMALGPTGFFLGWTPFMRNAIRKDARRGLELYRQRQK
jgi:hypothetical protein